MEKVSYTNTPIAGAEVPFEEITDMPVQRAFGKMEDGLVVADIVTPDNEGQSKHVRLSWRNAPQAESTLTDDEIYDGLQLPTFITEASEKNLTQIHRSLAEKVANQEIAQEEPASEGFRARLRGAFRASKERFGELGNKIASQERKVRTSVKAQRKHVAAVVAGVAALGMAYSSESTSTDQPITGGTTEHIFENPVTINWNFPKNVDSAEKTKLATLHIESSAYTVSLDHYGDTVWKNAKGLLRREGVKHPSLSQIDALSDHIRSTQHLSEQEAATLPKGHTFDKIDKAVVKRIAKT